LQVVKNGLPRLKKFLLKSLAIKILAL